MRQDIIVLNIYSGCGRQSGDERPEPYNANISQIKAEGLRDGEYELLVLAVRGDADADDA